MKAAESGGARGGFALMITILIMLAVAAISGAAAVVATNTVLIGDYYSREDRLGSAAEEGIEQARARLNGEHGLFPDSGYVALETDAPVLDAEGDTVPGTTRSTYVGPTGITSGQYGIYGTILSVVRDRQGIVVRRAQVQQESFSKYAYFTNIEGNIYFGGGDQIQGPVHSNDRIQIYSTGATFRGPVTTASTISGKSDADFRAGYTEHAPRIAMPQTADLDKLRAQAVAGHTYFDGNTNGGYGRATTRIEFFAIDLNGDGDDTDENEGFIRVYQSSDADWVVGAATTNDLRNSRTCGHYHNPNTNPVWISAYTHYHGGGGDSWTASVTDIHRRCFLGGADSLFGGSFRANDGTGQWLSWSGTVSSLVSGRADGGYLFPITRALNPDFKGVIFVDGNVAISGTLRGRVTVAATGDIVVADDIVYATDPSVGSCVDILGLFSADDVIIANTPVNAPWRRSSGQPYIGGYDDTNEETIDGFILALGQFTAEDYDSGSDKDESCEGQHWGRGCLYLDGGIIQETRGGVGTTAGTGYVKRYAYDACGATQPPPYFPTTGRFARGVYYDVDPVGFDVDAFFASLTGGS